MSDNIPPTIEEARIEIVELRKLLDDHSYRYYVLDQPVIDDAQFDALTRRLVAIENVYPSLITADSPTQRVGGMVAGGFERVTHLTAMRSLGNAFSAEELQAFHNKVRSGLAVDTQIEYIVELKIDGLAINLTYENGQLVSGVTRGDGTIWLKQRLSNNSILINDGMLISSLTCHKKLDSKEMEDYRNGFEKAS